ncbi:MAG: single-stranded-DNA-specific exonuclease RecJ [Candidatus Woykebacteria bacterium]
MVQKKWVLLEKNGKDLKNILLANRNIKDHDSFFNPHLYKLTSANKLFPDLDIAVERIKKAIKEKELIYIYGDFDVDGITAAAILWETIDFLDGKVLPYIPHRQKEGYGIHVAALEKLAKEGAKVVISVDCGITATAEAKIAKKLGISLIITDHHMIQDGTPQPFALLHTEKLAGSGVAFMLAKALLESFSKDTDEQLYKNLELAAIGTLADMVLLTGDNRIIAANGLARLGKSDRVGLRALYNEAAINKKIETYEVGFIISPRLNAAGRMENALDSLRLLLTRDKSRAARLAAKLSQTNRERQEATTGALTHARETVNGNGAGKIIIVHHESYNQGVVGLVAGRLADEFYRPAIAISETRTLSKGSGRSVGVFNITEAIKAAEKYLDSAGGHPMAAGFSIQTDKIPRFKEALYKYAEKNLTADALTPNLKIDTMLRSELINQDTWDMIREFEPFGIGNPEAVFQTNGLEVVGVRRLGKDGKHLRLVLKSADNNIFNAIGFGLGERSVKDKERIDIVYNLRENTWQGNKKIEMRIKDFRPSERKEATRRG